MHFLRSCEVRLRCREDIAAQKVFIYMLEPATCQYIVVLESPLFCDALQQVDKFGLFTEEIFEQMTATGTYTGEQAREGTPKSLIEESKEEQTKTTATAKKVRMVQFDLSNPVSS